MAAALIVWVGCSTEVARGDGDPASDVLASQSLFLAQDAGVPAAQQSQLAAILAAASRENVPVRVAVIASKSDLGSVTELWGQPQTYARFLGQELGLVYHGTLLVVMPDGYGRYHAGEPGGGLPPRGLPTPGRDLGSAALVAIRQVAAAQGRELPVASGIGGRGGGGSIDPGAWIAFAIGWILIATAWTWSLRTRPLRRPRTGAAATPTPPSGQAAGP